MSEVPSSSSSANVGWYPCPPRTEIPLDNLPPLEEAVSHKEYDPFLDTGVKKLYANRWNSIPKQKKEEIRRMKPKGVEVRRLPKEHFLSGQHGLFATEKFSRFDIIGEYVGVVVGDEVNGHYVAALEDKDNNMSLGVDAEKQGNEMRFINSYLNIGFKANVSMRTAYVETYPHIVIVCTEDIEVGEEILLDYGDAYNKAYLLPKPHLVCEGQLSMEDVRSALPFLEDELTEEDQQENN